MLRRAVSDRWFRSLALAALLGSCIHQSRVESTETSARIVLATTDRGAHLYRAERTASWDSLRLVIRDQASFGSLIRKLGFDTTQAPIIDFRRSEVIAASLGVQASYGPVISIDSVIDNGNQRRIVIRRMSPRDGCAVAQGASNAIDIVVVPARPTSTTIFWDERSAQRTDCGDPMWSIYPRRPTSD